MIWSFNLLIAAGGLPYKFHSEKIRLHSLQQKYRLCSSKRKLLWLCSWHQWHPQLGKFISDTKLYIVKFTACRIFYNTALCGHSRKLSQMSATLCFSFSEQSSSCLMDTAGVIMTLRISVCYYEGFQEQKGNKKGTIRESYRLTVCPAGWTLRWITGEQDIRSFFPYICIPLPLLDNYTFHVGDRTLTNDTAHPALILCECYSRVFTTGYKQTQMYS